MKRHNDILQYNDNVPRYTSYPTSPHFTPNLNHATFTKWLQALPSNQPTSLYLHILYCHQLCWFCGCHTKITQKEELIDRYTDHLIQDIELTAQIIGRKLEVNHLHLGGGTPNVLSEKNMEQVFEALHRCFSFQPQAEIAAELDPRSLTPRKIKQLSQLGFNRVSIGVQDFDPAVQRAVNRIQPYDLIQKTVEAFRQDGLNEINFDLMYGLPFQTLQSFEKTLERTLHLAPNRVALFAYAHLPWLKKHMTLIRDETLPDPALRLKLFDLAQGRFEHAGFTTVGLDHFVSPNDPMAEAYKKGLLRRNFMGYSTNPAPSLLGFGASSVSQLPQGFAQRSPQLTPYRNALEKKELPIARGYAYKNDDLMRQWLIEQLMCHLTVSLEDIRKRFHTSNVFSSELAQLQPLLDDGWVTFENNILSVHPHARQLSRVVAAAFDCYHKTGLTRHAQVS